MPYKDLGPDGITADQLAFTSAVQYCGVMADDLSKAKNVTAGQPFPWDQDLMFDDAPTVVNYPFGNLPVTCDDRDVFLVDVIVYVRTALEGSSKQAVLNIGYGTYNGGSADVDWLVDDYAITQALGASANTKLSLNKGDIPVGAAAAAARDASYSSQWGYPLPRNAYISWGLDRVTGQLTAGAVDIIVAWRYGDGLRPDPDA